MVKRKKYLEDKHGWIRIVEAFVAILLIAGVLILVVGKEEIDDDTSSQIQDTEFFILKDIELNNTLREEIVGVSLTSIEWGEFDANGLTKTKNKIIERTPSNLNCSAKICVLEDNCLLTDYTNKSVYTESVAVFSSRTGYNPRQLKLFCFEK